jgi:hypothetical protein
VPDNNTTLVILANSEDFYVPFREWLSKGQIEGSPFAKEFLDLFVKE